MITRLGKIGRLPKRVRNEMGLKIEDGLPGAQLAAWLNSLPEVQAVLKEQFDGRPVTEQNISYWKQHGHADWVRQLRRLELVNHISADAEELEEETGGRDISDRFASLVTVEVMRMAEVMLEAEPDLDRRWARLQEVNRELSRLRREDHQAVRAQIERAEWQKEQEAAEKEAALHPDQEERQLICSGYLAKLEIPEMTRKFGADERGRQIAGFVLEVQHNLPTGMLDPLPAEAKSWRSPEEEKALRAKKRRAAAEKAAQDREPEEACAGQAPAEDAPIHEEPEMPEAETEMPPTPAPADQVPNPGERGKSKLIQANPTFGTGQGENGGA